MAKKVSDSGSNKSNKRNETKKKVTSVGKSKFSRPMKRKTDKKRGVKTYRGQGR